MSSTNQAPSPLRGGCDPRRDRVDEQGGARLRPFEERDVEALALLLADLWFPDAPAALKGTLGTVELCHHLLHHDWSLVAEKDGVAGGVILCASRGSAPRYNLWRRRIDLLMATLPARARWDAATTEGIEVLEREQALSDRIAASGVPYADASVELFVTAPALRGRGVGGRLFSAALDHFRETGARGFYHMTDDGCDFGFYDHAGMRRVRTAPPTPTCGIEVYAYASALSGEEG